MSIVLTEDGSSFPSSVAVPESGDPRTAASVQTPFQAIANRTRNLLNRLLKLEGPTRKTVAAGEFQAAQTNTSGLINSGGLYWILTRDQGVVSAPLHTVLRNGATISAFDFYGKHGADRSSTPTPPGITPMTAKLIKNARVQSGFSADTVIATITMDASAIDWTYKSVTGLSEVIDLDTYTYRINVTSSIGGASQADIFSWAGVTFA